MRNKNNQSNSWAFDNTNGDHISHRKLSLKYGDQSFYLGQQCLLYKLVSQQLDLTIGYNNLLRALG